MRPVDDVSSFGSRNKHAAHTLRHVFSESSSGTSCGCHAFICAEAKRQSFESKAPNPDFSGGTRVGGKHMNTSFSGGLFALVFFTFARVFLHPAAIVPHVSLSFVLRTVTGFSSTYERRLSGDNLCVACRALVSRFLHREGTSHDCKLRAGPSALTAVFCSSCR